MFVLPYSPSSQRIVIISLDSDWVDVHVHVQFRDFLSPAVLSCLQFSSHRRHRQDKTRQFCLVCVGGVNYRHYAELAVLSPSVSVAQWANTLSQPQYLLGLTGC